MPLPRQFANSLLVAAEGQAFVEAGVELPFEFRERPSGLGRFDFVEAAFVGVVDTEKKNVVGPTEDEGRAYAGRYLRRCLRNLSQFVRRLLTFRIS